jgi:hypothetical protein
MIAKPLSTNHYDMGYILGTSRTTGGEPGPPGPKMVYVDESDVLSDTSVYNPGITPVPQDPTEWKVYRNGIRLNHGSTADWTLLTGGVIQFWAAPGVPLILNNDLIVVSYPIEI